MSATYPDYTYTSFPDNIDTFNYFTDISLTNLPMAKQYYQLYNAGDIEGATAILDANPNLKNSFIGASTLNPIVDAVKAIEQFYSQDVQQYLVNLVQDKGDFSATTKYSKYNTVGYYIDGATETFICLTSNTPIGTLPTNSTYWRPITMRGEQGESGIGLSAMGGWSSLVTYPADSMVSYDNALWASLIENRGIAPAATATSTWYKLIEFSSDLLMFTDAATDSKYQLNINNGNISFRSSNGNINVALKSDTKFETAGGTGTTITLNNIDLIDGFSKTFIAIANNNGSLTTINSLPIYKPNSTITPKIISGKAYTIWYSSTGNCFFVKASAEGNAVAANVLAGTTFSNDDDSGITGTMPTKAATIYSPSISTQTIASGQYLSGTQTIAATTGTATAATVLSGYTFNSANGIGLTGSMANFSGQTKQVANHGSNMSVYVDSTDARMGIVELPNVLAGNGFIDSTTKIKAQLWGLTPENIKAGVSIGQYPGYGSGYMTGTYNGLSEINGVIRSYYAYAGENISAGDFVQYVTGVAGIGSGTAGTRTITTSQNSILGAAEISETKVLVAVNSNGTQYFAILTIDGVEFSLGSLIASGSYSSGTRMKIIKLNNSTYIAVYIVNIYIRAFIINVSGSTITYVSAYQDIYTNSTNTYYFETELQYWDVARYDDMHFTVIAEQVRSSLKGLFAYPFSVNGTTIAMGSQVVVLTSSGTSAAYRFSCAFSPDGTRIFGLLDNNSSNTFTTAVCSVGPGSVTVLSTAIPATTVASLVYQANYKLFVLPMDNYSYLIVGDHYDGTGTYAQAIVYDSSYATVTLTAKSLLTSVPYPWLAYLKVLTAGKALLTYSTVSENNSLFRARVITLSGTSLTLYPEVTAPASEGPVTSLALIGAKILVLLGSYQGIILNAPTTAVEYYNYLWETQVKKSVDNDTISGVSLSAMVGGILSGSNAGHYQAGNVISKI